MKQKLGGRSFVRRGKGLGRVVRSPRAKHCLWEVRILSGALPRAPNLIPFSRPGTERFY